MQPGNQAKACPTTGDPVQPQLWRFPLKSQSWFSNGKAKLKGGGWGGKQEDTAIAFKHWITPPERRKNKVFIMPSTLLLNISAMFLYHAYPRLTKAF